MEPVFRVTSRLSQSVISFEVGHDEQREEAAEPGAHHHPEQQFSAVQARPSIAIHTLSKEHFRDWGLGYPQVRNTANCVLWSLLLILDQGIVSHCEIIALQL